MGLAAGQPLVWPGLAAAGAGVGNPRGTAAAGSSLLFGHQGRPAEPDGCDHRLFHPGIRFSFVRTGACFRRRLGRRLRRPGRELVQESVRCGRYGRAAGHPGGELVFLRQQAVHGVVRFARVRKGSGTGTGPWRRAGAQSGKETPGLPFCPSAGRGPSG